MSFVSHRPEAVASIKAAAAQRMLAAVITVQNETKQTLSGQRHGKVYKVPTTGRGRVGEGRSIAGTGARYTASAPGESPAVRLGGLRNSIGYKVHNEGTRLLGDVGTKLEYGQHLEYGTLHISPRPWLRKSFENATGAVLELWRRRWF